MKKKLTSQTYWENYYAGAKSDKKHIMGVVSYYDTFWDILLVDNSKNKTIIEIGGYPGRYLAYLSSKYGLVPTCLDYNSDAKQIEATFDIMEVDNYYIQQADFTTFKPTHQYDYVISNGFIEHFKDYNSILDKHLDYLMPGGRLLVMIPNKRYLRQVYGYLLDNKNLKAHNLNCMNLDVFKSFAKRNDLLIHTLQYYGGFPFSVHQKLNGLQHFIYKCTRLLFKKGVNPILMKHPSKYMSSTIIAIFEKPINS